MCRLLLRLHGHRGRTGRLDRHVHAPGPIRLPVRLGLLGFGVLGRAGPGQGVPGFRDGEVRREGLRLGLPRGLFRPGTGVLVGAEVRRLRRGGCSPGLLSGSHVPGRGHDGRQTPTPSHPRQQHRFRHGHGGDGRYGLPFRDRSHRGQQRSQGPTTRHPQSHRRPRGDLVEFPQGEEEGAVMLFFFRGQKHL